MVNVCLANASSRQASTGQDEERFNESLRPERLDDCIGQRQVIEQLRIALEATPKNAASRWSMFCSRAAGLGQNDIRTGHPPANWAATFRVTSGPAITKPGDLMHWLTELKRATCCLSTKFTAWSLRRYFSIRRWKISCVIFTIDSGHQRPNVKLLCAHLRDRCHNTVRLTHRPMRERFRQSNFIFRSSTISRI